MENNLVLVSLTPDQIINVKEENGRNKKFTHALVCGKYGIMFGTEKHCRKYYAAWTGMYKNLFDACYETDNYALTTYKCSGNVINDLIDESDKRKPKIDFIGEGIKEEKKGFISKLFGR